MNRKLTLLTVLGICLLCLICSCSGSKNGNTGTNTTEVTAPKGTQIVLSYVSNNSYAGKVTGETQQVIEYGISKSTEIVATPNLGYKFVKWSDGNTSPTRIGDMPGVPTEYVAEFALDTMELPILYITTKNGDDIVSKDQYIKGSVSVFNCGDDNFDSLDMQIRGRGNYTWNSTFNKDPMYNKRPYRIKLSEQKQLCGVGSGKSNDWVLLADHCDQSLLRNNIVYTFAASMPAIYWQPHVRSVEVYLNGQYNGVYLLCEQVEVNKNKVNVTEDLTDPEAGFLAMYSNYSNLQSLEGFGIYDDSYGNMPYEIKSNFSDDPDIAYAQKEYIINSIAECWDAVRSGDEQKIRELVDIDSVIDTYIVQEMFKNLDTGHDNFYMYKDKGGKLILGPVWDFDQCAGNANEDVDNPENIRGGNTQPWYIELLRHSWFKKLVQERWNSLKGAIDTVPSMITNTAKAGYNSYCRNFDKWQIFGYKINRETYVRAFTSYTEHYEFFSQFMTERIKWLDTYINSPTYTLDIKDGFYGNGTKEDPYIINSAEDFITLMQKLSKGESFMDKCFLQTADIDIGSTSGVGAPHVFAGFYNANGHTITANIKGNDGSLFPYVTGVIINLTVKGSIENGAQAGGIARSLRVGGAIVNCISYMNIKNGSYAAGIVASNQEGGNSTISNTFFGGTIEQGGTVAPICPWNNRRPGDFKNNYYIEGTVNNTANVEIDKEEFEISLSNVEGKLAEKMNGKLDEISNGMFFFDESDLCTWEYKDGEMKLISKE